MGVCRPKTEVTENPTVLMYTQTVAELKLLIQVLPLHSTDHLAEGFSTFKTECSALKQHIMASYAASALGDTGTSRRSRVLSIVVNESLVAMYGKFITVISMNLGLRIRMGTSLLVKQVPDVENF